MAAVESDTQGSPEPVVPVPAASTQPQGSPEPVVVPAASTQPQGSPEHVVTVPAASTQPVVPVPAASTRPRGRAPRLLRRDRGRPIGLRNFMKSSCYLNSVLQCLTFTPPLAEYCRRRLHSNSCTRLKEGDCTFCILEKRIRLSLKLQVRADAPKMLYEQVLFKSGDVFRPMRHEDAHELLRFLIHDCGKAFDSNREVMPPGSRNDPKVVLDGMFGGILQSHIQCRRCGGNSIKPDEMLDLSLEISKCRSLTESLDCFFRPEVLDGDNQYRCETCNRLSTAQKRMSIDRAPKVLTIQLMRFDPLSGQKLHHHVQLEGRLSVADYMTRKTIGPGPEYKLYGVVVHLGDSRDYGHYVAYLKEIGGKWFQCDDENVYDSTEEEVLGLSACLLFYIRSDPAVSQSC